MIGRGHTVRVGVDDRLAVAHPRPRRDIGRIQRDSPGRQVTPKRRVEQCLREVALVLLGKPPGRACPHQPAEGVVGHRGVLS